MTAITVLLVVAIIIGLANLGCTIFVVVKLYEEKGIFHALIGLFCCQLYPLIWGWMNAGRLNITDIMFFWTGTIVMGIILQVVMQVMQAGDVLTQF